MSETETAIEKFRAPASSLTDKLIVSSNGTVSCRVKSEQEYDEAGLLLSNLRAGKKQWQDWLKTNPHGKRPSECDGLEAAYYFAYQSLERMQKIVNDGLAWFEPREDAAANAIRDYDARKQAEIARKMDIAQAQIEDLSETATQSEVEETRAKILALAQKSEQIARGPAGTVKVTSYVPTVTNKTAFLKWVLRTENFHLIDIAEGQLKKHVNALAGKNLPDGVSVRREDIIRRKTA